MRTEECANCKPTRAKLETVSLLFPRSHPAQEPLDAHTPPRWREVHTHFIASASCDASQEEERREEEGDGSGGAREYVPARPSLTFPLRCGVWSLFRNASRVLPARFHRLVAKGASGEPQVGDRLSCTRICPTARPPPRADPLFECRVVDTQLSTHVACD